MGKALVIEGLTVSNPITTVTFDVTVESLAIDKNSLSLTAGDTATLTATVVTSDGSSVTATFESSNTSVASVSANGNTATITALASGNVTITVRAGSKTQTCSVAIASSPTGDLATYYTNNATIANADKTALNALVTGMSSAGIWPKVKRFYPILGTTLHDLVLEVKDNSSRGFDDTTEYIVQKLSATTNLLTTTANSVSNMGGYGDEPMEIHSNNIAAVIAATIPNDTTSGAIVLSARLLGSSSSYMQIHITTSANRNIRIGAASSVSSPNYPNVYERMCIMSANSSTVDFYLNGSKVHSAETSISPDGNILRSPMHIFNGPVGTVYKFFMITEALTESEALALSTLVETYIVATGKKSAS